MATYDKPHITLRCQFASSTMVFDVHYAAGQYRISTLLLANETDSELQELLQSDGYSRNDTMLQKHVTPSEIKAALQRLDKILENSYGGSHA